MPIQSLPYLGHGLGLRAPYYQTIIEQWPAVDWFEIISEDYMIPGGRPWYFLEQIRARYPLVMHGVSLSLGSCDPLNQEYLTHLKALAKRIEPAWVSDHLCWTGFNGINIHDLLPLPYTEEAITHIANRITQVQDFLGRQILIENVSSYINYTASQLTEWQFLTAIAEQADCLILLDLNNIYVNAYNHGFSAYDYLMHIPIDRVQQFHLAGHTYKETHIIDTHDEAVIDSVWDIYAYAVKRFGLVSTMIERDANLPPFAELFAELNHARQIVKHQAIHHATWVEA